MLRRHERVRLLGEQVDEDPRGAVEDRPIVGEDGFGGGEGPREAAGPLVGVAVAVLTECHHVGERQPAFFEGGNRPRPAADVELRRVRGRVVDRDVDVLEGAVEVGRVGHGGRFDDRGHALRRQTEVVGCGGLHERDEQQQAAELRVSPALLAHPGHASLERLADGRAVLRQLETATRADRPREEVLEPQVAEVVGAVDVARFGCPGDFEQQGEFGVLGRRELPFARSRHGDASRSCVDAAPSAPNQSSTAARTRRRTTGSPLGRPTLTASAP